MNAGVTVAIRRLEDAALEVSRIEEHIAAETLSHSVEGRIARRGAVSAAVTANLEDRAKQLVEKYLAEEGIDEQLGRELKALLP